MVQPFLIISSDTPCADITDFESDFADQVALSWDVQDLRFHDARTANKFTDEPVKAIDDLAKWAPTSMNDQPLRIVRVRSPATRDRLVQTMGGRQQGKDRRRSSGGHPGRGPRLPRRLPQGLPLRPRCTRHVRCRRRPAR